MSNQVTEQANRDHGYAIETINHCETPRLVGDRRARAVIQLSSELGFADIFSGLIPVAADTIVYDRSGVQLDTTELLTLIDTTVEA